MVLPAIPLIALGFLVTWLVLYGMTHGLQNWLASLLNALAHPQGNFFQKTALKVAGALVAATAYVFRTVGHSISQAAAHGIARVAHYIQGWAVWITHNAVVAGDFAAEVATAFERLTAHTIPRAVARAIAVPLHEVQIGLRHTERDLAQLRRYATGIDRLLRHFVIPGLREVAHAVDVTLPHSIAGVRSRVGAAERAISRPTNAWVKRIGKRWWILAGAGIMLKFLLKKFPHLFCRNTTKALKRLCGIPNSLFDDLLAALVDLYVVEHICDVLTLMEDGLALIDGPLSDFIGNAADMFVHCGYDLPPDLPTTPELQAPTASGNALVLQ